MKYRKKIIIFQETGYVIKQNRESHKSRVFLPEMGVARIFEGMMTWKCFPHSALLSIL